MGSVVILPEEVKCFAPDTEVREWLADNYGDGDGSGDGSGNGSGNGYGSGDGSGDGSGNGYGDGDGYGDGYGYGSGDGSGNGDGYGYGDGSGYGSGDITTYQGLVVYNIDGVLTIIRSMSGNYAMGYILRGDLTLRRCFIAKGGGFFAHGETLRKAAADLNEKLMESKPIEERIADFMAKFPTLDTVADGRELYSWHHILTGSCRQGRDIFCTERGLSLEAHYTIGELIELTKESYGGDFIKLLEQKYND